MSAVEKPDVIGATRRAETIRNGMIGYAAAMEAIGEAYEARDWIALGHKTWDDYCEKEFSEKRLKLTQQQREQAVLAFRGAGMSIRAIGSALGLPKSSVADTLSQVSEPGHLPAEVTGADGKTYTAARPAPQPAPATQPEEDHPGTADLGDEDGAATPSDADGGGTPSDAQPQSDVEPPVDVDRDETGAEAVAPRLDSAAVDERQPEGPGVSSPAADSDEALQAFTGLSESLCGYLYPHEPHNHRIEDERGIAFAFACPGVPVPNPVELLEAFADQYELLDIDAHGPLMTEAEFEALGNALIRVTNVVELLTRWQERTNP